MRPFPPFLVCVASLVAGCVSSPATLPESPGDPASPPVSIREAFSQSVALAAGAGPDISVLPGRVPRVVVGGGAVLAVPVTLDDSRSRTMTVRSRLVRRSDGTHVLFYPVVTVVDPGFNATRTLKPVYEFRFSRSENVLSNEFELPAGTKRLLVHTTDEYVRGAFVGTVGPGDGDSGVVGASAAAALGGALGAIAFLAANPDAGQVESTEYRFGPVGVISVEAR